MSNIRNDPKDPEKSQNLELELWSHQMKSAFIFASTEMQDNSGTRRCKAKIPARACRLTGDGRTIPTRSTRRRRRDKPVLPGKVGPQRKHLLGPWHITSTWKTCHHPSSELIPHPKSWFSFLGENFQPQRWGSPRQMFLWNPVTSHPIVSQVTITGICVTVETLSSLLHCKCPRCELTWRARCVSPGPALQLAPQRWSVHIWWINEQTICFWIT